MKHKKLKLMLTVKLFKLIIVNRKNIYHLFMIFMMFIKVLFLLKEYETFYYFVPWSLNPTSLLILEMFPWLYATMVKSRYSFNNTRLINILCLATSYAFHTFLKDLHFTTIYPYNKI